MVNKIIRANFPATEKLALVDSITELKALNVESITTCVVAGYFVAGDIKARTAVFDASSTATDNGGTVIMPTYVGFGGTGRWLFKSTDDITFEEFGAVLDGVTDDSGPFARAMIVAEAEKRDLLLTGNLYSPTTLNVLEGVTMKGRRGVLETQAPTKFITDQDISLLNIGGRFINLYDFTVQQTGAIGTSIGIEYADDLAYFIIHERIVTDGFHSGVKGERTLYHTHRDCFYESGVIGANYTGVAGAWNTDWFNNVILFERCRFNNNTDRGVTVMGVCVSFDTCDTSNTPIGIELIGDVGATPSFSNTIINHYAEATNNIYKFDSATVTITAGFGQGFGSPVAGDQIFLLNESKVFIKGIIDGQDLWDTFGTLTSNSELIFDDEQTFGVTGGFKSNQFTFDSTSVVKFMTQQFKGQTALLSPTNFEDIFTPSAQESYILSIVGDSFTNHYATAIVQSPGGGGSLHIVELQGERVSVTDVSGVIRLTNTSGADNQKYDWTLTKI